MKYNVGDRVKLTPRGKSYMKPDKGRMLVGVVARDYANPTIIPVCWDGDIISKFCHPDFVEPIDARQSP